MVMRLLPWARKKMVSLPQERAELQRDVRAYIHKARMCLWEGCTCRQCRSRLERQEGREGSAHSLILIQSHPHAHALARTAQVGPEMGTLYTDKQVKWDDYLRKSSSAADLQSLLLNEAGSKPGSPNNLNGSIHSPALAAAVNGRDTPPPTLKSGFPSAAAAAAAAAAASTKKDA